MSVSTSPRSRQPRPARELQRPWLVGFLEVVNVAPVGRHRHGGRRLLDLPPGEGVLAGARGAVDEDVVAVAPDADAEPDRVKSAFLAKVVRYVVGLAGPAAGPRDHTSCKADPASEVPVSASRIPQGSNEAAGRLCQNATPARQWTPLRHSRSPLRHSRETGHVKTPSERGNGPRNRHSRESGNDGGGRGNDGEGAREWRRGVHCHFEPMTVGGRLADQTRHLGGHNLSLSSDLLHGVSSVLAAVERKWTGTHSVPFSTQERK